MHVRICDICVLYTFAYVGTYVNMYNKCVHICSTVLIICILFSNTQGLWYVLYMHIIYVRTSCSLLGIISNILANIFIKYNYFIHCCHSHELIILLRVSELSCLQIPVSTIVTFT